MSSEIRPEDIEAAIAAAEQRRRSRLGGAGEPAAATGAAATGTTARRPLITERMHGAGGAASDAGLREKPRPAPTPDDLDDSWLDQPVRPRPSASRYADLPEGEVVWEAEPGRRGLAMPSAIAAAVLLLFGGILWWVYGADSGDAGGEVPVIAAAETPIKEKPAEEGGLEVPDQDKLVYGNIAEGEEGAAKVEQLLPAPEEPVTPPQPQVPAVAATAQPSPLGPIDDADTEAALAEAAPPAAPAAPATSPAAAAQPAAAATPPTASAQPAAPEPAAAPAKPAASSNQQQAAAPAAAAPVAPVQPAAGGKWKIQLASVKSEQGARHEWGRMQKTHPDMLGDMKLTVQRADLGDKGVFFRIQAGPLPDRTTAEDVCAELKAAKQPCLVVKP